MEKNLMRKVNLSTNTLKHWRARMEPFADFGATHLEPHWSSFIVELNDAMITAYFEDLEERAGPLDQDSEEDIDMTEVLEFSFGEAMSSSAVDRTKLAELAELASEFDGQLRDWNEHWEAIFRTGAFQRWQEFRQRLSELRSLDNVEIV